MVSSNRLALEGGDAVGHMAALQARWRGMGEGLWEVFTHHRNLEGKIREVTSELFRMGESFSRVAKLEAE